MSTHHPERESPPPRKTAHGMCTYHGNQENKGHRDDACGQPTTALVRENHPRPLSSTRASTERRGLERKMVCTRVGMVYGGTEPHFVRSSVVGGQPLQ